MNYLCNILFYKFNMIYLIFLIIETLYMNIYKIKYLPRYLISNLLASSTAVPTALTKYLHF